MAQEPMVYIRHFRQLGYCSKGGREFFRRQGWNWFDFLKNGLPASRFESTGDVQAMRVAGVARGQG